MTDEKLEPGRVAGILLNTYSIAVDDIQRELDRDIASAPWFNQLADGRIQLNVAAETIGELGCPEGEPCNDIALAFCQAGATIVGLMLEAKELKECIAEGVRQHERSFENLSDAIDQLGCMSLGHVQYCTLSNAVDVVKSLLHQIKRAADIEAKQVAEYKEDQATIAELKAKLPSGRYLAFAYDSYETGSPEGWCMGTFDTIEEARNSVKCKENEGYDADFFDMETGGWIE